MSSFTIPEDGVVLIRSQHDHASSSSSNGPTQIMRLNLAQNTAERILKTLRNNEPVKLRFGKRVSLEYGKTVQHIQASPDTQSSELFYGSNKKRDHMYFSGKSSHTLEVQKAHKATEQSDEALATLQNTLKSMQEQKASNETSFVTNKDDLRQLAGTKKGHKPSPLLSSRGQPFRKDHLLSGITHSTPSSPFLGASFSPGLGPTSTPLLSASAPSRDKIRIDAMKIPLIHLLAVRPMTPNNVAHSLRAAKEDCEKLLDKFAQDSRQSMGKKELKEKSYKELDVWKFPYPSQDDRQAAIDRTIRAFDRMRVGRSENLWQLLLPEERRGKGECLSKLRFDQPVPTIRTPQLVSEQSSLNAKGASGHATDTDTERGRTSANLPSSTARASSQNPVQKKRVSEKETISKQQMKKGASDQTKDAEKRVPKPGKSRTKQESKYKSAEIIRDSDEELEEATAVPSKSVNASKERQASMKDAFGKPEARKGPLSPVPKKAHHESKSSQSSNSDNGTAVLRKDISLKPTSRSRNESTNPKLSPRPRNGSSPNKPSPLASSPPTNANDPDTATSASNSSKSSDSSTAASSPPSSTDLRKLKSSEVAPGRQDTSVEVAKTSLKRKADTSMAVPVTKRHQVSGDPQKAPVNETSMSKHTLQAGKDQQSVLGSDDDEALSPDKANAQQESTTHRSSTDSEVDVVSPEEKTRLARLALVEKGRNFKVYYARYKDMHDKVSLERGRDAEALRQLLKMHDRIAGLKKEIWDEWYRLGKPEMEDFVSDAASVVA